MIALVSIPLWADEVPPVWEPPASMVPTLRDLVSRLPEDCPAWEPCPITWGHESSHFLSLGKPGWHGLYFLNGERRWVPIPPLITEQVFAQIPVAKRGNIYDTYLNQARSDYWSTRPVMILDEWVAYLRGAQVRQELGWLKRGETVTYCVTMAEYAHVLYRMAREIPDYDHDALQEVCAEILEECRQTIPGWEKLTDVSFD